MNNLSQNYFQHVGADLKYGYSVFGCELLE